MLDTVPVLARSSTFVRVFIGVIFLYWRGLVVIVVIRDYWWWIVDSDVVVDGGTILLLLLRISSRALAVYWAGTRWSWDDWNRDRHGHRNLNRHWLNGKWES